VICVWDKGASGGGSEHLAISHVLNRLADLAIVTQPLPKSERERVDVEVVADRSEAIACAVAIAEPGDVVVIAGSCADRGFFFGHVDASVPWTSTPSASMPSASMPSASMTDEEITRQLLYAREQPAFYRGVA